EIEIARDRAADVAVEAEDLAAAGKRPRCRRAVQLLRREYVEDHRRGGLVVIAVGGESPTGPGHAIAADEFAEKVWVDVGHQRPQPGIVGAELLGERIDRAVIGSAVT